VFVCFRDGTDCGRFPDVASNWFWGVLSGGEEEEIIGWRYALAPAQEVDETSSRGKEKQDKIEFARECFIVGCESAGDDVTSSYAELRWTNSLLKMDLESECIAPPNGWTCSRKSGHEGPCAAIQKEESKELTRLRDESDKMRAAIVEAHAALEKAQMVHSAITRYSQQTPADLSANIEHCGMMSDTLEKLQPFITTQK
jgi:hypothetical protein